MYGTVRDADDIVDDREPFVVNRRSNRFNIPAAAFYKFIDRFRLIRSIEKVPYLDSKFVHQSVLLRVMWASSRETGLTAVTGLVRMTMRYLFSCRFTHTADRDVKV